MRCGALLTTLLLALITYHGFEKRASRWQPRRPSAIFLATFASVGIMQLWLSCRDESGELNFLESDREARFWLVVRLVARLGGQTGGHNFF